MECIGSVLSPAPPTAAGSGSGSRGGEGAAGQQGDSGSGSGPRALGPGGAPCIQVRAGSRGLVAGGQAEGREQLLGRAAEGCLSRGGAACSALS